MSKYPFREIEQKWQAYWETHQSFAVTEDENIPQEKRVYVLDMFPYPSGSGLHVGHPEGYTATDIYCRYLRMNGYNVLHPMGFDSFGLPAENYAIQTGTHPKITTENNIANFRRQIKSLGFSYDWSREVSTHTSDYYRWTQWIFIQLFNKGLAYESNTPINWCDHCKTGLANEEVKEGRCERCGTAVVRRNIRQWVLKITEYADRLLEDLEALDWPESVKAMQRNWIGRSEGASVLFHIDGMYESLEVFTTRADTLFGATYMVISPEHPLVEALTTDENRDAVVAYLDEVAHKSDLERTDLAKEKTGVFSGSWAINPVNGERIPIWIADYVLISYGTGAIMAVPAHDERDWEFAKKFGLPIIEVLKSEVDVQEEAWTEDGVHVNSGFLDGLGKDDANNAMIAWLEERGLGKKAINYKLRDWIFSRQRYWGEPIPLVHCPTCGTVPVPESDLPLLLPEVTSLRAQRHRRESACQDRQLGQHRLSGLWRKRQARPIRCPSGPVRAGTTCATSIRTTVRSSYRVRRSATGCPSTSTSVGPSMRCSTSSTPVSGTRCSSTWAKSPPVNHSPAWSTRDDHLIRLPAQGQEPSFPPTWSTRSKVIGSSNGRPGRRLSGSSPR